MPLIPARPDDGTFGGGYPVVAPAADSAWYDAAWTWATGSTGTTIAAAITAAFLGGLAVHLYRRRPSNRNISRHLMYLPLLLVNAAAVYGQVAFFYESVAPGNWAIPGKLALSILIAAAIESIAVYVGWHAHDALLMKASATAARLRRASYLLALIVGAINYAHFAGKGGLFDPTAASVAFGLLSLLSPWLWGLHTRRAQHVQLTKEGAIDVAGATFSAERIWAFPIRAWGARRWSIDNYVTDPQTAWDGYNAHLDQVRAVKPSTRARAAWMVLVGHADIEPGVVPTRRPGNGMDKTQDLGPGNRPGIETGHTAGIRPAIEAGTAQGTATDNAASAMPGPNGGRKTTRTPTPRRASNPGVGRASHPTSAQLKAFKLREQHPGITWAQLAARVGKNERTVRRWFEAARPPAEPEERALAPTQMPTFPLPKELVSAAVNGNHFKPEER